MNIVTVFNGKQKNFHMYWLPLIYKHQEVMFYIQEDSPNAICPFHVWRTFSGFSSQVNNNAFSEFSLEICAFKRFTQLTDYKSIQRIAHQT